MAAEITTEIFKEFESKDVTDGMLAEAAQLFSEHLTAAREANEVCSFAVTLSSLTTGRQVCWVTQLVVHDDFRERRLATRLLEKLRKKDDEIFGIMSSHPAALIAIAKACAVPLGFMKTCASEVMAGSPIAYVKAAKLCGSLFQPDGTASDTSLVSGVNTDFFVNHEEPLSALQWLQGEGKWPLAPRRRSRSLSRHRVQLEETS
ncbi:hypothetical protein B0T22DRAFT_438867 [Podospora appendiculata]|uniref:N-acetyltransferase domain-containing protein n=1 Tax=Podospora appendiculata TaxID=314037 RepID=A0AAE1CB73_9PEZI|nr:hypothetical protein B0T22DRAFT_438867 [Podospora appendiculata]